MTISSCTKKLKTAHSDHVRATTVYIDRRANIDEILRRVHVALEVHRAYQLKDEADWGFPGDLGRVQQELAYTLASLGDTSAAEELGLEC